MEWMGLYMIATLSHGGRFLACDSQPNMAICRMCRKNPKTGTCQSAPVPAGDTSSSAAGNAACKRLLLQRGEQRIQRDQGAAVGGFEGFDGGDAGGEGLF